MLNYDNFDLVPHKDPNTAFASLMKGEMPWIELFHSRPSWKTCQISFSKDEGRTWVPFGKFQFVDASAIRDGFRTFRIQAESLHFQIANSNASIIDDNRGRNFFVDKPGRYVIEYETGCRRVSDAQVADCLRPLRPRDLYIELTFQPATDWPICFVRYSLYKVKAIDWLTSPMNRSALQNGTWCLTVEAPDGIDCAFNDGADTWDNNDIRNYQIRLPGKYNLGCGTLIYRGISKLDAHIN